MSYNFNPRSRGVQFVRADGTGDLAGGIAQITKAFEEFKKANDERLEALAKGKADVVLDEKVDRINAEISELQKKLADIAQQAAGSQLGSNAAAAIDADVLRAFAAVAGREVSADEYRAYREGLTTYLRKGDATPRDVMAAMSVGSDPEGGYTVTPDLSGRIVKRIFETSPMRQVATVTTISSDSVEGFYDLDEASAGWVGELESRNDTATPKLGKWNIPVHEMYAQPKATQKLLDDSAWDIEGWLAGKVADKFTRMENEAFVKGNGILKPRGFLTYPTAATGDSARDWGTFEHVATGASGAFNSTDPADVLIDAVFKLKNAYRDGAVWMMNRATLAAVRKLKDSEDRYVWQPDFSQRLGGNLLGYPIVEAEDMPTLASNSLSIVFGNFAEAYTIVDRTGIRVLRDPYTNKPNIRFYTTKRVGGDVLNFEALKFIKFGS